MMGKSLPSATKLRDLSRIASEKLNSHKFQKPRSKNRYSNEIWKPKGDPEQTIVGKMDDEDRRNRVPLASVVSKCVNRWFHDTLKEAKAGDSGMQVLVGQMYYSGYGVPRDVHKGRAWIAQASKSRASVWKVCNKRPGYNASDSDSHEVEGSSK